MSAIENGYKAVAEVLWTNCVDHGLYSSTPENFIPLAKRAMDAWLKATNPVGLRPAETIYGEFYRLRAGARVALMAYDESQPVEDGMEVLRAALIAVQALEIHDV